MFIFLTETEVDSYLATMETEEDNYEKTIFGNITETRQIDAIFNAILPTTDIPAPKAAARLNAADDHIIDPNKSLAVQPGDHISLEVTTKYIEPSSTSTLAAASVLDAVVNAFTVTAGIDAQILHDALNVGGALLNAGLQDDPDGNGVPRAYLNYILFNTHYEFKDMGALPVTSSAESNFEVLQAEVTVTEPGYMYIYVSNESKWDVNVFFDDLKIEHEHSKILQQEDFYPWGLTFSQSDSYINKYLYNYKEFQTDLNLVWYDYGSRFYDAAVGRWHVIDPMHEMYYSRSPYNYVLNNPVSLIDPNGTLVYDWKTRSYRNDEGNEVSNEEASQQLQSMGTTIYSAEEENSDEDCCQDITDSPNVQRALEIAYRRAIFGKTGTGKVEPFYLGSDLTDGIEAIANAYEGNWLNAGGSALAMAIPFFSWKSVKFFHHTFRTHGQGEKITQSLIDRARSTGKPQGQWLDNERASQILQEYHREAHGNFSIINLPDGVAQVIRPDGTIVPTNKATVIFFRDGTIRTAFPTE